MPCVQTMLTMSKTVREPSQLGIKISTSNSTYLRLQRKISIAIKDTVCQVIIVVAATITKDDAIH